MVQVKCLTSTTGRDLLLRLGVPVPSIVLTIIGRSAQSGSYRLQGLQSGTSRPMANFLAMATCRGFAGKDDKKCMHISCAVVALLSICYLDPQFMILDTTA